MIKTFIQKGVFTICLNLLILLVGIFTYPYLSNEFIPSVEIPAVAVVVPMPLMEEGRILREAAIPIEDELRKSGKIKTVETRIEDGKLIFILFYKWDYDPDYCLRDARNVVGNIQLPPEALKPIFVLHRPSNNPVLKAVFYGDNVKTVSNFARKLQTTVERVPGVSQVKLEGDAPSGLEMVARSDKLAQHNLNSSDILLNARMNWNFRTFVRGDKINHYISFPIEGPSTFNLLPLANRDEKAVPMNWVGELRPTEDKVNVIYGKDYPAVVMEILKVPGSDTIGIVNKASDVIKQNTQGNSSVKFNIIYNEAEKIQESQAGMYENFLIGVGLNSIILMVFLGSSVGVLVASVVFPTAIFGTIFVMNLLGISFNLFSLNGFSLAVGMITDASTVVLESVVRRIQKKEDLFSACWKGAGDVGLGVLASTLTTAGVLLPIAMQKNLSSKLFSDLSLTVVSTQLVCLIAVFSLVPWLCFKMFENGEKQGRFLKMLYGFSSVIVNAMVSFSSLIQTRAFKSKAFRLFFPLGVTLTSLFMAVFLPQMEFLPQVSSRVFSLSYPLPRTTTKDDKVELSKELAGKLNERKDLEWSVTKQTPDGIEAQAGFKTVIPPKNVLSTFNESTLDSKKFNLIPVGPAPSGEAMGFNGLFFISENIDHDKMTKLWNTFCDNEHIDTCLKQEHYFKTDARLRPRHLGSAMMGVTSLHSASQIFLPINQVDLSLLGNLDTDEVLNLNIPSRVNLLENSLEVKGGWATSIGSHYDTVFDRSKTLIMRLNGTEFRSLFFRLKDYTLGAADFLLSRIRRNLDVHSSAIIGRGELENMNETFAGMIKSLIISTFIVFLILVVQFKSVAQTLVIMGTIPLTLGGAVAGLIIMGETVNASVLVGFILLIGIVVNNGIFLVEATNQHLTAGKKGHEAVKTAVQERTRPILMTSFSTIFGMFPVLLLGGEGSELYRGMAIVNVFGMVAGTFLSLVVTPLFIEYLSIPKNMRD